MPLQEVGHYLWDLCTSLQVPTQKHCLLGTPAPLDCPTPSTLLCWAPALLFLHPGWCPGSGPSPLSWAWVIQPVLQPH